MTKACGMGKIGAAKTRSGSAPKSARRKVCRLKVHEYEQSGRVSKKTIKPWLTVTRDDGRLYAKGTIVGLRIMATSALFIRCKPKQGDPCVYQTR